VSILRSLYIDNDTRNPKVKGVNEYVTTSIYNWESDAYILRRFRRSFLRNVIAIISSTARAAPLRRLIAANLNFNLYATNNWQDRQPQRRARRRHAGHQPVRRVTWANTPFAYPFTNAVSPLTAVKLAISDAGTSWQRDSVDERMMTELMSWGTLGETIASEYASPMSGPGTVKNGTPYTTPTRTGCRISGSGFGP